MDIEFIWIFIVCLTSLMSVSTLPTHSDMCGKILTLDTRNLAAELSIRLDLTETNYDCQVTVLTEPEFQIAYILDNPGSFDIFSDCEFSVTFDDHITQHHNICFDSNWLTFGRIASGNKLTVHIQGDLSKVPSFRIQFISVRKSDDDNGNEPKCRPNEHLCYDISGAFEIPPVCLEYSLICYETLDFCPTTGDECSDTATTDTATTTATGIETYTIVIVVVIVIVMIGVLMVIICVRRTQAPGGLNTSAQDIRARAMAIFSTQLATRGVDSADGNENRAYLDEDGNPIDFSKFDPPPEYGSLEQLSSVGVTNTDESHMDEEEPPSYDQVMTNSAHFNVTTEL